MKPRWLMLLCALGLTVATAVGFRLWIGDRGLGTVNRGLETYQGKSIRDWSRQYADTAAAQAARAAARAAFAAMDTNALPELIRLVNTDDPFWRRDVWEPGTKLPKKTRLFLTRHVAQPDLFMDREAAVRVLADYGAKAQAAIPALVGALESHQGSLCTDAAFALGRIGKPAVPALIRAAQGRDAWTRRWAVYALGRIGSGAEAAVPVLVKRLQDREIEVREQAVRALGQIGPVATPATPALRQIAQDTQASAGLRAAAKEALGNIEPR